MKHIRAACAAAVVCVAASQAAIAAPPLYYTTRTQAFSSTSTAPVSIPLHNNGATAFAFETTIDNQPLVITYNAECVVVGQRGTWLTISIFVDGIQTNPAAGTDFALCTAIDNTGKSWGSVSRQAVITVPTAGPHTLSIKGRLAGGPTVSGTWRLDDTSLVIQRPRASATRTGALTSSATVATELPLKDNGGTTLNFNTPNDGEQVKLTYNAECVVDAEPPGHIFSANFVVDGSQMGISNLMCSPVDSDAKTWAGALRQHVVTVPDAGDHQLKVIGALNSSPGSWRVDDSSLVVTRGVLAFGAHEAGIPATQSTEIHSVPIRSNGGVNLVFTTTEDNQTVKFSFYAMCRVAAPRGRWVGIRVVVDGQDEAAPASGYDFAFCSSVVDGFYNYWAGFRQSVITVPTAGEHTVRVFARLSSGDEQSWGLHQISMVVE